MTIFQPYVWHQELEIPNKTAMMFCSNHFIYKQIYFVLPDNLIFPSILEKMYYTILKQNRNFMLYDTLQELHNLTIDLSLLTETSVLFLLNIHAWQDPLTLQEILEKRSSRGMQTCFSANVPIDLLLITQGNPTIERLLKDSMILFLPSGKSLKFNLFVYGTLKKGFGNHHYLKTATLLGAAKTALPYPMILKHKAFPYLINKPKKGLQVKGELYQIDYPTLLKIDELEGYPEHYTRCEIDVLKENDQKERALVYFINEKINYKKYDCVEVFENQWLIES